MSDDSLSSWIDLLHSKEILGATSSDLTGFMTGRTNLLVGECELVFDDLWIATQYIPTGTSSGAAIHEVLKWDNMRPLGDITLNWDKDLFQPKRDQLYWCVDVVNAEVTNNTWDYAVTQDSLVVPFSHMKHDHMRMLSLFGGGIGGWSYALSHLAGFHAVPSTAVMIENDLTACIGFCINHDTPLVNGFYEIPSNLMSKMNTGCAIHANVSTHYWLPAMAAWHPNFITVSAPCTPWSAAAKGPGLTSVPGLLLPESLFQCRFLQPDMIGLEQVAGFNMHEHKHAVLKTIYMIGYTVAWSKVVDLLTFGPVRRSRWLALLRRVDAYAPCDAPVLNFPSMPMHTPRTFDACLPFAQGIHPMLKITPEMLEVSMKPGYLPPAKRAKTDKASVLELRTYTADQQIPVCMASYGSQHLFSHEAMRDKGCLMHFFQDDEQRLRLLHPCEIAMLHGIPGHIFTFHDFAVSWKHMGNQIAFWHAMLVVLRACKSMSFAEHIQVDEVVRTWESQRFTQSNSIFDQGEAGFHLRHVSCPFELLPRHHANIKTFLQERRNGFMPEGCWWDIEGLHPNSEAFPNTPFSSQEKEWSPATIPDTETTGDQSPTQDFCITIQAKIDTPNWHLPFWFASDVNPAELTMLWNADFNTSTENGVLIMRHAETSTLVSVDHDLIVFLIDGRMTVYSHKGEDVLKFCQENIDQGPWYDQFGELQPGTPFNQQMAITKIPQSHNEIDHPVVLMLAAFQNCTIVYKYQHTSDIWFCEFFGSHESKILVANMFAHAIAKDTLLEFGRTVSIEHGEVTKVMFKPACQGTPVPPNMLTMAIAIAMTRAALDSLQNDQGLQIVLKWQSRTLWKGKIDMQITSEVVQSLLMYTLSPVLHLREVRLIHKGKRFASGPFSLCNCDPQTNQVAVFYLGEEIVGGAGTISTKSQLRQQVRNSIAAWLLESDVELQWVHENIEQAIDNIGVKTLVPIIQQPASTKRDSQLQQAFANANISIPKPTNKISLQATRVKVKRRSFVTPDPSEYKVDCTFLLKQDDTQMTQLHDFRANMSGVFLTNASGALPWLRENQQISADELGLLVIGHLPHETTLPCQEIALPCFNANQQQVLLQVTLVQFGGQMVKIKEWDKTALSATQSKVCALTLWQDDFSPDEWTHALQHTQQFLRETFANDGLNNPITSSWGRSLRKGRQPATNKDATSLQIHAAI